MTLCKGAALVKLEPQVFSLLELLIRRHGDIVSRDDIIEDVWQGRSVSNGLIDSRIQSVRQAIGDDGKTQRLIKTFTHQGFKFVGSVIEISDETINSATGHTNGNPMAPSTPDEPKKNNALLWLAPLFILSFVAAIFLIGDNAQLSETDLKESNHSLDVDHKPANKSIAVLPTTGFVEDPRAKEFSMVVAEETHSFLASVSDLDVVSRSSSFAFQDREFSAREINEALNVDYRIESRYRLMGEKISVAVQLIHTSDEMVVWAKHYNVPAGMHGKTDGQNKIARNVSQNVANLLGVSSGEFSPKIVSAEAYHRLRRGNAHLIERSEESLSLAIEEFETVVAAEPDYLPAYAKLFDSYWAAIHHTGMAVNSALPEMHKLVRQMQLLGPDTPETLTAQALLIQIDNDNRTDHERALPLLERAVESGPNYARAREELARALLGAHRYRDAAAAFEKAMTYDPVSAELLVGATMAYYSADDFDAAFATARRNLRWNPDSAVAKSTMAHLLVRSNRQHEAYSLLLAAFAAAPEAYAVKFELMVLHLYLGAYEKALRYAPSPPYQAYVSAIMGDEEAARNFVAELPDHYFSKRALYLLGEEESFHEYLTGGDSQATSMWEDREQTHISIVARIIEARLLRAKNDPRSIVPIEAARQYFENHPVSTFETLTQYAGAIGLHILDGNLDSAIAILANANREGYIFFYALDTPLFEPLAAHPQFDVEYKKMKNNADKILIDISMKTVTAAPQGRGDQIQ